MSKLSVVITAYNEETKIKDCLESVKDLADEIILVDNDSTDKTAQIATQYTRHIFHQKNDPEKIDLQKNFGFEKATNEWILSLDADERVTKELAEEIRKTIGHTEPVSESIVIDPRRQLTDRGNDRRGDDDEEFSGYFIPRKNIIFGKWIEHTGWYPDHQLRLFKKGKGKYIAKHYHEPLKINGEVGYLAQPIVHYNYETVSQFFRRNLLVYAPNEADELLRKGYLFDWRDAVRFPVKEFLSRYFARQGYKDGLHGLILSLGMAASHLAIFCYLWEKKKFAAVSEKEISLHLENELKKSGKEIQFWLDRKKIEEEKNPIKKMKLKLKRKFTSL